MKTIKINPVLPELENDPHPLAVAQYIVAQLFRKHEGSVFAKWDQVQSIGLWCYTKDTQAILETPAVDEVLFRDSSEPGSAA